MKRKFLEEMGLSKDQVDSILDENSQDIGKAKSEVDSIKGKLTTVESELNTVKETLKQRDDQLEVLRSSTGDVESLKQEIEKLQTENKTKTELHEKEVKQMKIDFAITELLNNSKAKNVKAVKALLDLNDLELLDDGSIKGLKEQIDSLVTSEDTKFLFAEKTPLTIKGAKPGNSKKIEDGIDPKAMSYDELCAYLADNPDANLN